jgi:magnesium chelatase subunit I
MKKDDQQSYSVLPFAAIIGQEKMKLALMLNAIYPGIGGVLIMGHRGTAKSTSVRALADLLPLREDSDLIAKMNINGTLEEIVLQSKPTVNGRASTHVPMVTLPLSATEDRVVGTLDIEAALAHGKKLFEPGLLAKANGGFLYIDEVNLLEDHLVDLLLDVAASGINIIEREGLSVQHPANFVLVGSGNPEEGDLRPQLLDRFGLYTQITTITDIDQRMAVIKNTEAYRQNPTVFIEKWRSEQEELQQQIVQAITILPEVVLPEILLAKAVELCLHLKIDGHRGEITISRASRALAALHGRNRVTAADIRDVAPMSLQHRLRKDPLDKIDSVQKIENVLIDLLPVNEE